MAATSTHTEVPTLQQHNADHLHRVIDGLIYGYLERRQYTRCMNELLAESPHLTRNCRRDPTAANERIFICITSTLYDQPLEEIIETFQHHGRLDLPPDYLEIGKRLRDIANDFSTLLAQKSHNYSDAQNRLYGRKVRLRPPQQPQLLQQNQHHLPLSYGPTTLRGRRNHDRHSGGFSLMAEPSYLQAGQQQQPQGMQQLQHIQQPMQQVQPVHHEQQLPMQQRPESPADFSNSFDDGGMNSSLGHSGRRKHAQPVRNAGKDKEWMTAVDGEMIAEEFEGVASNIKNVENLDLDFDFPGILGFFQSHERPLMEPSGGLLNDGEMDMGMYQEGQFIRPSSSMGLSLDVPMRAEGIGGVGPVLTSSSLDRLLDQQLDHEEQQQPMHNHSLNQYNNVQGPVFVQQEQHQPMNFGVQDDRMGEGNDKRLPTARDLDEVNGVSSVGSLVTTAREGGDRRGTVDSVSVCSDMVDSADERPLVTNELQQEAVKRRWTSKDNDRLSTSSSGSQQEPRMRRSHPLDNCYIFQSQNVIAPKEQEERRESDSTKRKQQTQRVPRRDEEERNPSKNYRSTVERRCGGGEFAERASSNESVASESNEIARASSSTEDLPLRKSSDERKNSTKEQPDSIVQTTRKGDEERPAKKKANWDDLFDDTPLRPGERSEKQKREEDQQRRQRMIEDEKRKEREKKKKDKRDEERKGGDRRDRDTRGGGERSQRDERRKDDDRRRFTREKERDEPRPSSRDGAETREERERNRERSRAEARRKEQEDQKRVIEMARKKQEEEREAQRKREDERRKREELAKAREESERKKREEEERRRDEEKRKRDEDRRKDEERRREDDRKREDEKRRIAKEKEEDRERERQALAAKKEEKKKALRDMAILKMGAMVNDVSTLDKIEAAMDHEKERRKKRSEDDEDEERREERKIAPSPLSQWNDQAVSRGVDRGRPCDLIGKAHSSRIGILFEKAGTARRGEQTASPATPKVPLRIPLGPPKSKEVEETLESARKKREGGGGGGGDERRDDGRKKPRIDESVIEGFLDTLHGEEQ